METDVQQVAVTDVPAELGPSTILLDVREHDEWNRGHAPGAQHIPMGEVPARLEEIAPGAHLLVVCKLGGRSLRVAQFLKRQGYDAVNVDGGMQAWAQAGRTVVTDDGGVGSI
jgi:rhodanese-related sulfurtransferase